MDCAPFSQTQEIFAGAAMIFFMFTTFWFWALWFEGPAHESRYWVKRINMVIESGDEVIIRDKKGDTMATVDYFYRNFLGRMRVKVTPFYLGKGRQGQKTYAPSRLNLSKKKDARTYTA